MLRCLLTLCLIVFSCHSLSSEKTPFVKVTSAWNKPSLITDNDPACQSLLEDAQSKFYSDIDWGAAYGVRGHGYVNTGEILDWTILGGDSLTSLHAYDKDFYLYNYLHNGCSGACERQQSLVSTSPFTELTAEQIGTLATNAPPAMSYGYTYAQSGTNIPYMFVLGHYGADIGLLFVYRLSPNATWAPACEINLTAAEVPFNKEHSYFSAMKSFDDLYQSTLALSQGNGGSCGRMNTRWRWDNAIKHQLSLTLTRPWAMGGEVRESENSHGNYSKMITDLERWSLTGFAEQKAFNGYKHQLAISIKSLSQFYQQANHWHKQQSDEMAELALTSAISAGFGFYMYNPEFSAGEFNLRNAIITKQSLDTIKKIEFIASDIDSIAKAYYSQEAQESILNLAIDQPEVLEYLLQQGISPNLSNAFGKTPLMYTAQYNLLESAKLLIQHGANTVANTTIPDDTCYYALSTFKMTALHYAVRYASPDFIKLLIDNGAATYMKAENHNNYPMTEESPLDWFYRYTDKASAEINSHIPQESKLTVQQWLTPPSSQQLDKVEKDQIKSAIAAYQQGKVQDAYEYLIKALSINPKNEKALSDMSLIALKNNQFGHSLSASNWLINHSENSKTVANAWFNQGLVCDQHQVKMLNTDIGHTITYDGQYYCAEPAIYSYINAWMLTKNIARKNKIISQFDDGLMQTCSAVLADNNHFKFHFENRKILILRSKNDHTSLDALFKNISFNYNGIGNNSLDKNTSIETINTYDIDDYVIEEVNSPFGFFNAKYNGQLQCQTISAV